VGSRKKGDARDIGDESDVGKRLRPSITYITFITYVTNVLVR